MSQKRSATKSLEEEPVVAKKNGHSQLQVKYTQLFINNEFVDSVDGRTFDVINPATEEKICSVQRASEKDCEIAIQHARKCFDDPNGAWRRLSQHQRGRLLYKLADLIERDRDYISRLESLDNGKPLSFSRDVDVALAIKVYRYYAGWCDKIHGKTIPIEGDHFCYTREEPVGVCGQIIPWNFPLLMQSWKWGPCLATGCVSILKTSEKTPLTALYIASLAKEAGFPPGAVQVLSGYGDAGEYLVKHRDVDKIAFTGSTGVGKKILVNSQEGIIKRVTLELGGKSANIICHDADLDLAVKQSQVGLFLNQGQCCIAGSRVYVHEKIYDEFVKRSIEASKKIKLGDPFDENTNQGPQVDEKQFKSILNYIDIGKKQGANLALGGNRWGDKGYYIEPTIFTDVKDDMTISKEEIFGPVMSIHKFSSYDEVIQRANNSQYGLGAGVVTQSVELYQKLANSLRAGTVYVNCYDVFDCNTPFGGFRNSGIGRELGEPALRNYLENKTVILKRPSDSLP